MSARRVRIGSAPVEGNLGVDGLAAQAGSQET
jgi:hypothetical protein